MITRQLITFAVVVIIECNGIFVDSLDITKYPYDKLVRGRDVFMDDLSDKENNIILLLRNDRNIDRDLSLNYLLDERKKYVYYHPADENFDSSDHSLVHRSKKIDPVHLKRGSKKMKTGSVVKNEKGPAKKLFLPFIAKAGRFLFRSLFYTGVAKGVDEAVDYAIKKNS